MSHVRVQLDVCLSVCVFLSVYINLYMHMHHFTKFFPFSLLISLYIPLWCLDLFDVPTEFSIKQKPSFFIYLVCQFFFKFLFPVILFDNWFTSFFIPFCFTSAYMKLTALWVRVWLHIVLSRKQSYSLMSHSPHLIYFDCWGILFVIWFLIYSCYFSWL